MTGPAQGGSGPLEWAVATRPLPGEVMSGDAYVVSPHGDQVTMAVIDGLGHGPSAAEAADRAVRTIRGLPGTGIRALLERCHEALAGSRGAAMTILEVGLTDGTMSWLGVGSVDAWILRRDLVGTVISETALPAGGVVGLELPVLLPRTVKLRRGDVIVMVTDGVSSSWLEAVQPGQAPSTMAQRILDDHSRPGDDALVLTARYRGPR